MKVIKTDGTVQEFKIKKLSRSLKRSGAGRDEVARIVAQIEAEMSEGMTTGDIYKRAFTLLKATNKPVASKYSLRRAIFDLGTTGFPFEEFLSRLFEEEGYKTRTGIMIRGACAQHEIDVAGYSPEHSFIAEAKFHAKYGIKTDLQVALYSYARYVDLKERPVCKGDVCGVTDFILITNTRFTSTVRRYAKCVGLDLLSWEYPKGNSLHERIEGQNLYPITALTTLTKGEKTALIKNGVILTREIVRKPQVLKDAGIKKAKTQSVIDEANHLCC